MMKRDLWRLGLFVFSLSATSLGAPTADEQVQDYGLGSLIGHCVAFGCQVFRGFLVMDAPKAGDRMAVHIDRVLYGAPIDAETLDLPYDDYAHAKRGDGGSRLADAWSRVQPTKNLPVIVVLGTKKGPAITAGEPVVVTGTERECGIALAVTEDALRLQASPGVISGLAASLVADRNPGRAGFLHAYISDYAMGRQTEVSAIALLDMLNGPSVPDLQVQSVMSDVVYCYPHISLAAKTDVLRRIAGLGSNPNPHIAAGAYVSLAKIARSDGVTVAAMPPETLKALGGAYRALVARGGMKRDTSLDKLLGVSWE